MMTRVSAHATMGHMPNKPKTPGSTFRIPLDLKAAASAKAAEEGKTLTEVINEALVRYTKKRSK